MVFSRVFTTFGIKNTVNTHVFGGSEAQNHGIYDVFLPLVVKSTVFTVFFGEHLAKTLVEGSLEVKLPTIWTVEKQR